MKCTRTHPACAAVNIEEGTLVPGTLFREAYDHEGIADDYFSTRWLIESYRNKMGEKISGVKELIDKIEAEPFIGAIALISLHPSPKSLGYVPIPFGKTSTLHHHTIVCR